MRRGDEEKARRHLAIAETIAEDVNAGRARYVQTALAKAGLHAQIAATYAILSKSTP